jgi:Ca-activated chloride channel family protein
VVLEPTPGDEVATISTALDQLQAGGSTNGAGGIQLAYEMAAKGFIKGGNNRVLLATDGDFNVGISDFEQLKNLVEEKRRSGVALSTLGFGEGNYNDKLMEQLADAGNGNYAYIDTLQEAQKVLVDQRAATLATIAKDVKIQVEFNPAVVAEYRLIGYENRLLKREDFNNDAVDAGEIGAGHRVTALYEIALVGNGGEKVDPLRYGKEKPASSENGELAFLRLRYKKPEDGNDAKSILIERPILTREIVADNATTPAFRLAAAVAAYGQLLRGGTYTGSFGYADVAALARGARGDDVQGYAGEFLQLAQLAGSLETRLAVATGGRARGDD